MELDLQASQTRLSHLNDENSRLRELKKKIEEAKSKGNIENTFYTPEVKLRTYYGMAFVRPSVRLSVSHIMSAQYLEKFMSDRHGTW